VNDIITTAERLADELLFPRALETDRADTVPVELLDALAAAGLYGLSGPRSAGGLEADFATVCAVGEALSSGCLTTTFVWAQHVGAVIAVAQSQNQALAELVPPLCRGDRRAGLALGGALPGPAQLTAQQSGDGWIFSGVSPFVSGWGRVDVIHTAARSAEGQLIWALLDAQASETLHVEQLRLVALNATATVRVDFADHRVPPTRVTSVVPYREGPAPAELLRIHASFPLGVAARCCRLLKERSFDVELARLRADLDRLDPATIEAARAAAGDLAFRTAAALSVERGSRSLLRSEHAQRLVREALFCLIYALPPTSRAALLAQLQRSSLAAERLESVRQTRAAEVGEQPDERRDV
jgi:alkylation response protein AidB-like acyl-CoA dehydrogenase